MNWNVLLICIVHVVCGILLILSGVIRERKRRLSHGPLVFLGSGLICVAIIVGIVKLGIEPVADKVHAKITGTNVMTTELTGKQDANPFIPDEAFKNGQ